MPFSTIFRGGQFYWWRKLEYTEKITSGDRHWIHRR